MTEPAVEGLANVRDLGGLVRLGGGVTPHGVFLRSENLDRVTSAGWETLRRAGVSTVLDLRRPDERTRRVPDDVAHVTVDLDGVDPDFWTAIEADGRFGTPIYYAEHLERLPDRMREVLDALASAAPGAVLFHCGAGWDRTGFVAAMLLRAANVTPQAAVDDYELSFANAAAMERLHGQPFWAQLRSEVLARFGHTAASALAEAYAAIDLPAWFDRAEVDATTKRSIMTWRGALDA